MFSVLQTEAVPDADVPSSEDTIERAKVAQVENLSDLALVQQCDVILSVVPPRYATSTAQRIIDALSGGTLEGKSPLYYADLNAVSPSTCRKISALFGKSRASVRFIDGCILGGPPALKTAPDAGSNVSEAPDADAEWSRPSLPVCGPHKLSDIAGFGPRLFETLNMRHIAGDIGAASGLKMCFASASKGLTAIGVQSFTTAARLSVLTELQEEMRARLPDHYRILERGVVTMPPKAYRWVREMEEISQTHEEDGGFGPFLFKGAAGVYKAVADDSVLGLEKIGKRKRGLTVEDVAAAMAEGLERKKKKTD